MGDDPDKMIVTPKFCIGKGKGSNGDGDDDGDDDLRTHSSASGPNGRRLTEAERVRRRIRADLRYTRGAL